MADTQPNLEVNTELSSRATLNTDQSTPMAVLAKRESGYRMVEIGRMKPYCLQLDASLIEVMDSPPPPAHAWMSGIVADIIRTILPDLNEAAIAGDGIAILFFGRRAFGEGLFPQQAEEYAARLARQIEWVGQLVLLTATPLPLSEGRQTVAHYRAMVRMNQWNAFSATQTRHKTQHHYYSGTESDEDLVGNPPSVVSSQASSIRGRPMTRGGRRGRSTTPSRGAHQQTDLDETPHDSSVSPPCQTRHPATTEGRPSNANEKKDWKG